jgi:hypothetical protein
MVDDVRHAVEEAMRRRPGKGMTRFEERYSW